MAQDWDIKPRSDVCRSCQKPFEDRQSCFSSLVFTEDGYVRGDYCEACRTDSNPDGMPFSTWQGQFLAPPPKAEDPLKKETAESLLRRMMENDDHSKTSVIYILAVMLERKKILVERDVQTHNDGNMVRVYEHRETGETFLIPEPRLRLDQLEDVQADVIAMLGVGTGTEAGGQKSEVRGQRSEIRDQGSEVSEPGVGEEEPAGGAGEEAPVPS